MPVLNIVCPDCRHEYRSLVMEGARTPRVWVCPECKGRRGEIVETESDIAHPWAGEVMDLCCACG